MEWNEKLQHLRKQKGLTQEELATALFVSRTAISKWESGRGYPNIDSLKAIANFFSVTIDELLCGNELLTIAEQERKEKQYRLCNVVFGLVDICTALLLFLPFFAQRVDGTIQEVSLLSLTKISPYLHTAYLASVVSMIGWGVLTLALQDCNHSFWGSGKNKVSLILSVSAVLLFVVSLQPYAAIYLLIFAVIKVCLLAKCRDTMRITR
jgi:transcriptional regulator with XRE-family HTH domain